MSTHRHPLLVGFDGSPDAIGAIELGARLLPGRHARIAHLWAPPFAASELRARVWRRAPTARQMIDLLEEEARAEAERTAAEGVTLASAAGWTAEALAKRAYGAEGLELAALAEELEPEALVVGSRGLSGVSAVLGSVSDEAVHASPVPVLVVPRLVLSSEREAAGRGPILVGDDGSEAAAHALATAGELFGDRTAVRVRAAFEQEGEEDAGVTLVAPRGVASSGRAIADGLVAHAQEIGAAAIVVGSRGRSAAREILLGSTAMAVLHHADRPVVVVPAATGR